MHPTPFFCAQWGHLPTVKGEGGLGKASSSTVAKNVWNKTSHQGRYVDTFSERLRLMKRSIWGFLKHPVDPVAIHWIKGHPGFTSRSKCFTKQVPSPHIGYPKGPKLSYVREYCNSQIYEICDSPHESEYKNVHLGTLTLLKSHHLHKSNAFGKLSITWADDREKNSCCQPLYNHYIIGTSYSVISCAHKLINKHAGIYAHICIGTIHYMNKDEQGLTHISKITHLKQDLVWCDSTLQQREKHHVFAQKNHL